MPCVVVAGLAGGSGKTLVSLALLLAARERGLTARAFKKGPDYIDAAWLGWAAGSPARNLDTRLMGFAIAADSFARHAAPGGFNLVEGNRGLFDGSDAAGTHSTAELAKALNAPVLLVVDCTKVTRTAAALVLGCMRLDPQLKLAGVILNQVAGPRHEAVLREAVGSATGLPVLGVAPRLPADSLVPERHLGLVPPAERGGEPALRAALLELASGLDLEGILALAAPDPVPPPAPAIAPRAARKSVVGWLRDAAFTFYYPENLEALERRGAELVPVSALESAALPAALDALYIGGGFPETHAPQLAANRGFLDSLRDAARGGLRIYAECGGLMLLARQLRWQGRDWPMAGVFDFDVEVCASPQGHGYAHLRVDRPNPFFAPGTTLRGHEFHYSRVTSGRYPETVCRVERGVGCYDRRDGIVIHNVWASYTHLHALSTPEWPAALIPD